MALNTKPAVICGIGPAANGKSTLLDLMFKLICSKQTEKAAGRVARIEMSTIITKYGLRLQNELGDLVQDHVHLMAQGKFLPDHVINPLFEDWLENKLASSQPPQLFIIGGLPRTVEQLDMVERLFSRIVAVHQDVSKEHSFASMRERLARARTASPAEIREDDAGGDEVLEERWSEHLSHTPRIIKRLEKKGELLDLDRSMRLTDRLILVFKHLQKMDADSPAPQGVVTKALNRLWEDSHCVHEMIHNVEHPGVPYKNSKALARTA